jgi:hypothetical protein
MEKSRILLLSLYDDKEDWWYYIATTADSRHCDIEIRNSGWVQAKILDYKEYRERFPGQQVPLDDEEFVEWNASAAEEEEEEAEED